MLKGKDGTLRPPETGTDFEEVTNRIVKSAGIKVDITSEVITTKDSSNMEPNDWICMGEAILRVQNEGVDAILITHGTDTLATSAAALSFALNGLNPLTTALEIPVVMTGSQTPIWEQWSWGDATSNFLRALLTAVSAAENCLNKVMVVFGNLILAGAQTLKRSDRQFEAFYAPSASGIWGNFTAKGVEWGHYAPKPKTCSGTPAMKFLDSGVVSLDLGPEGTDPDRVNLIACDSNTLAVVLKSPGEGNIPTRYLEMVSTWNAATVLTGQHPGMRIGAGTYELGAAAIKAGVIPAGDTTSVASVVKARWLLAHGILNEALATAYRTSYCHEVTSW